MGLLVSFTQVFEAQVRVNLHSIQTGVPGNSCTANIRLLPVKYVFKTMAGVCGLVFGDKVYV